MTTAPQLNEKPMNRHLWRLELAASMIRHGWSVGTALYVLRGGYDDPYYDSNPDDPVRAQDVLAEEVSCQ